MSARIATSNGTAIAGVTVTRTGSTTPVTTPVTTNSAGYYTFYGVPSGTYTLTPSLSGNTFTPAGRTLAVNGANSSGNNFTGSS